MYYEHSILYYIFYIQHIGRILAIFVTVKGWLGQKTYTPYITIYLVISLPNITYIHRVCIYMVLAILMNAAVRHLCLPSEDA
jgi:hypothetical protein